MNKTLYDVICVVEEHNDIFAVFDRSTELFSSGGSYFQMVEQQLEDALNKVTLQHLIVKRKPLVSWITAMRFLSMEQKMTSRSI